MKIYQTTKESTSFQSIREKFAKSQLVTMDQSITTDVDSILCYANTKKESEIKIKPTRTSHFFRPIRTVFLKINNRECTVDLSIIVYGIPSFVFMFLFVLVFPVAILYYEILVRFDRYSQEGLIVGIIFLLFMWTFPVALVWGYLLPVIKEIKILKSVIKELA